MLGLSAVGLQALLDVGVECLAFLDAFRRREDHFGGFRCELAAWAGRSCLYQDRVPLWRARNVERSADREVFAVVIEKMKFVGIEIAPRFLVAFDRIVFPAIPQPLYDFGKLG